MMRGNDFRTANWDNTILMPIARIMRAMRNIGVEARIEVTS